MRVPHFSVAEFAFIQEPGSWIPSIAAMALLPLVLAALAAFLKLSIVAGLLWHGMGAQRIPSAALIVCISVVGSIFVMAPVVDQIQADYRADSRIGSGNADDQYEVLIGAVDRHLGAFVDRQSDPDDREWLAQLQSKLVDAAGEPQAGNESSAGDRAMRDLLLNRIPAYFIAELRMALQIGVLLILPFWIIDLVVSNIILAMGLNTLSTEAVTLPLKLILFISMDGWRLVIDGLIAGYVT